MIIKSEDGNPIGSVSDKDLVRCDGIAFASSKSNPQTFAFIGRVNGNPAFVYAFDKPEDAIAFASFMLKMVRQ